MPTSVTRWFALALALGLIGCGRRKLSFIGCSDDSQCNVGQVCFADGCGDPNQSLAVEIRANPTQGQFAQDIGLSEIRKNLNFDLGPPAALQIGVTRNDPDGGTPRPFTDGGVSFSAQGESTIIPGIVRTFQASLTSSSGTFAFFLGAGRYTLTLAATDPTIPPSIIQIASIAPGDAVPLDVRFPSADEAYPVSGTIVRTSSPRLLLDRGIPMAAQVLDATTEKPLSQRFAVASSGSFFLPADPSIMDYALRIFPQDSHDLAPEKTFRLRAQRPPVQLPDLELGNYGTPLTLSGRVLSSNDTPVAEAAIFVEGTVAGGGTFRSTPVQTQADGAFSLTTLPLGSSGSLRLWAVPKPGSKSAVFNAALTSAQFQAPSTFRLMDRAAIEGIVRRPDGSEASSVRVIATQIQQSTAILSMVSAQTTTDAHGAYALFLDPGLYRLDFIPSELLPRASRFVEVPSVTLGQTLDIDPLSLSKATTITGVVSLPSQQPATFASVRFFRVIPNAGALRSIPIAETVTNGLDGTYSVNLPTR